MQAWEQATVFRHFGAEERAALAAMATRRSYGAGEVLAHGGQPWPYLVFVVCGQIQLFKVSPDGRVLMPAQLRAGDAFFGHPFFDQSDMPATLEALGPTRVLLWHGRDVLPLFQRNPQSLMDVAVAMSGLLLRAAEFIEDFAFQTLPARLARLLLAEYEPVEGTPQQRRLSLSQMAARTGSAREVVCRVLHQFSEEGLMEVDRQKLVFLDLDRLRSLAGRSGALPN